MGRQCREVPRVRAILERCQRLRVHLTIVADRHIEQSVVAWGVGGGTLCIPGVLDSPRQVRVTAVNGLRIADQVTKVVMRERDLAEGVGNPLYLCNYDVA